LTGRRELSVEERPMRSTTIVVMALALASTLTPLPTAAQGFAAVVREEWAPFQAFRGITEAQSWVGHPSGVFTRSALEGSALLRILSESPEGVDDLTSSLFYKDRVLSRASWLRAEARKASVPPPADVRTFGGGIAERDLEVTLYRLASQKDESSNRAYQYAGSGGGGRARGGGGGTHHPGGSSSDNQNPDHEPGLGVKVSEEIAREGMHHTLEEAIKALREISESDSTHERGVHSTRVVSVTRTPESRLEVRLREFRLALVRYRRYKAEIPAAVLVDLNRLLVSGYADLVREAARLGLDASPERPLDPRKDIELEWLEVSFEGMERDYRSIVPTDVCAAAPIGR
jgi:hypothetical protein